MEDNGPNVSNVEATTTPELYFLIYKFLANGPCQRAAKAIREEIELHKLMPKRTDWLGNLHARTLDDVERSHPHISNDHLVKICSRIGGILDKEIPPSIGGVASLLGAGKQSLLRRKSDAPRRHTTQNLAATIHGAPVYPSGGQLLNYPAGLEYRGPSSVRQTFSCKLYDKQKTYRRLLGHLSSVYCVLFDRTGHYIITGADDLLVKIWSARDGRLLSTLRGHSKEISDLAINYENTLLAAGSCDKTIRIWCLKTTAPKCVLTGHQNEITSVKFCPLVKDGKSYLVSTANDGCVIFWRWDVASNTFETPNKPTHKFIERTKPGVHILCSSFSSGGTFLAVGSTDHFVRVYHVNAHGGPQKILEIEEHSNQVDSIQFSNLGFRFISGSKDGKAHIWWYERQGWKNHLLKMTERMPGDPPMDETDLNKLKVNMVGWTCDDNYVVTSASDRTIKVWNPLTGKLIYSLPGHEDEVFVLEAHPHDPRIMLSAGHDGRIIIWDILQGIAIKKIHNIIEGQGHGAIFDCKFSPDGQTIASTDSHGHITIYGFGSSERYQKVPEHVFFHTDYRPLIRDTNNYVIDEQTQCPPHLMPPPFLVDIDGNPHPPTLQRLVPGRENDSEERLIPHIAVQNNLGVNEILEPAADADDNNENPENAPFVPVEEFRPTIDDMIQRLDQESRRLNDEHGYAAPPAPPAAPPAPPAILPPPAVPAPSQPIEPSQRSPAVNRRRQSLDGQLGANNASAMVGIRRAGDVEGVRVARPSWQSRDSSGNIPVYARRVVVASLSSSTITANRRSTQQHAEFETLCFNRENRKKAFEAPTAKMDASKGKFTRRKRRMAQQRQGVRLTGVRTMDSVRVQARSYTNRRHPAGTVDFENPELSESGSNGVASGAESWGAESSSSSDSSDSESEQEWDGDEPTTSRSRKSKPNGPARPPKKPRRASNSDNDPDHSDHSDDDDEENSRSSAKSNSSNKSKSSTGRQAPEASSSQPKKQKRVKKSKAKPSQKVEELYNSFKELPPDFRFPEWLTTVTPRRSPYFPQPNDEVVYFKQGHQLYFEEVRRSKAYEVPQKFVGLFRKKTVSDMVNARVVDVSFEVKPPRLAHLKLAILGPDGKATNETFTVVYHDVPNVIDFIVLKQHVDNSLNREHQWSSGTRFRAVIDNQWWLGTVEVSLKAKTPFQSLKVQWDSGEIENICPWDLEDIDDSRVPEHGEGIEITEEEHTQFSYQPQKGDWPDCGRDAECDRIATGLAQIMTIAAAEPFLAPVDTCEFPVYGIITPYPIDLTTIRTRVENRFYRRREAIVSELKFLETNTKNFNTPESDIVLNVKMITDLCIQFVEDITCTDPIPIFTGILENKVMYEATDSEDDEGDVKEEVVANNGRSSSTGGKSRRRSTLALSKNRAKKQLQIAQREITSNSWKRQCKELIDYLFTIVDSEPFRYAVDPIQYPDYNRIIQNPMDMSSVLEQLMTGNYETPTELRKDIQLIFKNAKEYTPNKRSPIHSMTIRMSALCEERLAGIIAEQKSALQHERRGQNRDKMAKRSNGNTKRSSNKKSKSRSPKKSKKKPSAETSDRDLTSPDFCEAGPSGSGTGVNQPGPSQSSTNGRQARKRLRISSGEDAGCSGESLKGQGDGAASKSRDFYKALVQSSDSEDDDDRPPTATSNVSYGTDALDHADSDTEIEEGEEKCDTDATEIAENEMLDGDVNVGRGSKRKRPARSNAGKKNGVASSRAKRMKNHNGSEPTDGSEKSFSGNSESHTSAGSRSGGTSIASEELNDLADYEDEIKPAAKKTGTKSSSKKRSSRRAPRKNDSGSDFEYESFTPTERVSSRGRIIKNKGHARAKVY